jgi:hypothetical protein
VRVQCEPKEQHNLVELYLRNDQDEHRRKPEPGPWETQLAAGIWTLGIAPPPEGNEPKAERLCYMGTPVADQVLRWPK